MDYPPRTECPVLGYAVGAMPSSRHNMHVRSCPAAEQAPDRPDLYAAIRRDHKWRGRAERRISHLKRCAARTTACDGGTAAPGAGSPNIYCFRHAVCAPAANTDHPILRASPSACGGHPVRPDSLGCSHSDQPRRGSSPVPVRATGPLCYFHHRVRYTSSLSAVPGWRRVLSSMLALLNIGDEVVQWLGAGANDKAGDQQVGPKRRLSTAVGADACKSVIFSSAHRRKARPVASPQVTIPVSPKFPPSRLVNAFDQVVGVRLSEGCVISGCFGHAAKPRSAMLAGS